MATTLNNGQGVRYKEVRFSPAPSPKRRARSLATSNLLREPIDYTGRYSQSNDSGAELPFDFAAYIEQSRAVLESQRASFERERATFAQERKLWDRERLLLRSRIADLEAAANKSGGGSSVAKVQRERGSGLPSSTGGRSQQLSGTDRLNGVTNGHHVWEGSSPGVKPTRVFPDESNGWNITYNSERNGEDNRGSLDAALSPKSRSVDRHPEIRVPIEKIDKTLDGITLKSSGLPPEIVAKVISESPESPAGSSAQKHNPGHKPNHKISLANLGPPEENLIKDAGHTPMAVIGPDSNVSNQSPNSYDDDDEGEAPLAPQTTICRPYERSDSYFPEPDDDPALTGPLGLKNEETADTAFLGELDQRLLDEAKRIISPQSGSGTKDDDCETNDGKPTQDEPEPELKLRQTSNFGTAFGSARVK